MGCLVLFLFWGEVFILNHHFSSKFKFYFQCGCFWKGPITPLKYLSIPSSPFNFFFLSKATGKTKILS